MANDSSGCDGGGHVSGNDVWRFAVPRLHQCGTVLVTAAVPVGFGMDPFHAGLLVLAVFAGNLSIKPATTPLIRWLGFKKLLLINGGLNVLGLLACALLTSHTPVWLTFVILYLGGVFRSVQFTGVSTLAFSDVPSSQMSYANTLFSTATQLAVGLGITLGAIGIRIGEYVSQWLHITAVEGISFRLAFVFIALICPVGMVDTLRLTKNAGSAVSQKKQRKTGRNGALRPADYQARTSRTNASISLLWQFSKKHCWKRSPETAVFTSSRSIARRVSR